MIRRTNGPRAAGFTLVELLVAMGIIAVLVALLLPAIQRFRVLADQAKAATEIAQLANAIGAFKAKFQIDYLPSGPFQLKKAYNGNEAEYAYLKQLFPQMSQTDNGYTGTDVSLDANQALVFFLTGGAATNYTGFSNNKQKPFSGASTGEQRIGPFLEVTSTKLDSATPPHFIDPWGTPYAYFTYNPSQGVGNYSGTVSGVSAYYVPGSSPTKYYNERGYQIISAGPNKQFGAGGSWNGYGQGDPGTDDQSNFNAGALVSQK